MIGTFEADRFKQIEDDNDTNFDRVRKGLGVVNLLSDKRYYGSQYSTFEIDMNYTRNDN